MSIMGANILTLYSFESRDQDKNEKDGRAVAIDFDVMNRGKHLARWEAYCAGRAALKRSLDHLGLRAYVRSDPQFGYLQLCDAQGRRLDGWYTNIAHTERFVVTSVSQSPVGVDVERRDRSVSRIIGKIATNEERTWVENFQLCINNERIPGPLALWCAKEAFTKAIGTGLSVGLHNIQIGFAKDLAQVRSNVEGPQKLVNPVVKFLLYGAYLVAVCCEAKPVGTFDTSFTLLNLNSV